MKNNFQDILRFFVTKGFFSLVPLIAFCFFILLFVYAYGLEQNRDVPSDMKAPFIQTTGKPQTADSKNKNRLEQQNRSGREISILLSDIIAEGLSFDKNNAAKRKAAMAKYFTQSGYSQYLQFLESAGMETSIIKDDLQSGVILNQSPLEVSAGVYSGAYKWLFEAPITISVIPRDAQTYRGGETSALNRRAMLRVQFTRVNDLSDPDAVKIELWQAIASRS